VTLIDRLALSHSAHSKYLYTYRIYSYSNEESDAERRMTVDLIGWSVCLQVNVQIVLCAVDNIMATSLENCVY
jgi:hypothetical protein